MQIFYWIMLLIAIGIAIFAVQNSNTPLVTIKFLLWRFETFLIYTILGSIGIGILITLFLWIPRAIEDFDSIKRIKGKDKNLETFVLHGFPWTGREKKQRAMKKAIIIPIYLRLDQPEELPNLEGLRLAKRAIESLKILEDQDFTLILPVCFDLAIGDEKYSHIEMDRFLRKELLNLREGKTLIFSPPII